MAQLVERMTSNHEVRGSNPRGSSCPFLFAISAFFFWILISIRTIITIPQMRRYSNANMTPLDPYLPLQNQFA